jgi:Ca2+-binding EF-hand superfamily protein
MIRWLQAAAIAAVVCAFALGSAMAAEGEKGKDRPKPTAEQVMKKIDTNSDGKISLEEWLASPRGKDKEKAEASFKKIDSNSDGSIDLDELKAMMEKAGKKKDTN